MKQTPNHPEVFSLPAELPLGVLTAFIGVPLFLAMLRQFRSKV